MFLPILHQYTQYKIVDCSEKGRKDHSNLSSSVVSSECLKQCVGAQDNAHVVTSSRMECVTLFTQLTQN